MNNKIKSIFKKELKSYFISPIAYIVIGIFLVIIGWLFFSTFFLEKQANMVKFFSLLPISFAFIIPAVTMRLFSEEINAKGYHYSECFDQEACIACKLCFTTCPDVAITIEK